MMPGVELRPFQAEDLARIGRDYGDRCLLAWQQGLGKTVLAGAWRERIGSRRLLVVCPAVVKDQWRQELADKFGVSAGIATGQWPSYEQRCRLRTHPVVILNYDILPWWWGWARRYRPDAVVGDEVQLIGNLGTRRSRYFRGFCGLAPRLLFLSGTPLENSCWELYPALHTLCPRRFASSWSFGVTYTHAKKHFGKWTFKGARNTQRLHRVLTETCMIRRTKAEVAPELPPLTRTVVPLELPAKALKEYRTAERDVVAWLAKTDLARAIRAARDERRSRFTYLKQLAAQLKLPLALAWLDQLLTVAPKVLVGCYHRKVIAALEERYGATCVSIHGGKTRAQRLEAERLAKTDPAVRLLAGQLKACGVGLNLRELPSVVTLELGWTATLHQQFDARPHRVNSTEPVDAYYLVAADTVEEDVCRIIQAKGEMLDRVLDGAERTADSLDIFDQLHARLVERRRQHGS